MKVLSIKVIKDRERIFREHATPYGEHVSRCRSRWEGYIELRNVHHYLNMTNRGAFLDVGCADGRFLDFVNARLPEQSLFGIDFTYNPLRIQRSRTRHLVCGDICDMPFQPAGFEYACSIGAIQHIPSVTERYRALANIHFILKTNAAFVLTVPNQKTWHDMVDNGKDGPLKSCPDLYIYLFNPSDLRFELEQAGFAVEKIRGINILPARMIRSAGIIGVVVDLCITRGLPGLSLRKGTYLLAKCKKK